MIMDGFSDRGNHEISEGFGLWPVACVPRVRMKVCMWMILDDCISNCMPSDAHILR